MAFSPRNAQERAIAALLKEHTKRVQEAFFAAIRAAGRELNYADLMAALQAGDVERAAGLFRFTQAQLFPLEEEIRAAYIAAGTSVAAALPRMPAGSFGFNGRHFRAEFWIRANAGETLVEKYGRSSVDAAREIILRGFEEGRGVAYIGQRLGGRVIRGERLGSAFGLSAPHAASIERGAGLLASGDPTQWAEYRKLKLRDRSFDRLIARAEREGRDLTAAEQKKIIQAHTNKAIRRRAADVARNEAFTAQSMGREEGWRQVSERSDVEAVTKRWQHNLSDPARADHEAMNGTVIPVGEDFQFPDVAMSAPHDPRGGPKHSMGCRCVAIYRMRIAKR